MKTWVSILMSLCVAACSGGGDDAKDAEGAGSFNVTKTTFVLDKTFTDIVCTAMEEVCACDAELTSCPGNDAAVELYSCLWYAADFGNDGIRSGLGDGVRGIEATDEHLCRTMDTPGQYCPDKMATAFRGSDQPYRGNIWDYLDPKPSTPSALIEACASVMP
jgi:hypothetical protein